MILIGENINVMSKTLGPALKEMQAGPILEMIKTEDASDVDYMDLNIGPARLNGTDLLPWLVDLVQANSEKHVSLDTSNSDAIDAALAKCNKAALINSVSLQPERLEKTLPLVSKYDADMIGLLWGEDGMPRDVDERCMHMVDLVLKAQESGVSEDRIWIDPIATPISGDINQVLACLDFMDMLPEINPNCKSIVGLSNVSNGTPRALRPYLNRTYLAMLKRKGLYSAIVDATDYTLIDIARDRAPEITEVIYNAMDGDDSIPADPELAKYAKTVQVLLGKKLYSHMWLD